MQTKLPPLAEKALKKLGWTLDRIPDPKITMNGKQLSPQEIVDLAESVGAVQGGSRLFSQPYEIANRAGGSGLALPKKETVEKLASPAGREVDPVVAKALALGAGEKPPVSEMLEATVGNKNPLLLGHRAFGEILENNTKLAQFVDALEKGRSVEAAVSAVKTTHFDYRDLTEVEKRAFRLLMPFYAWSRCALPRMFQAVITNPGRMAKIPKLKESIARLSGDWQNIPTPDYFAEVQAAQIPFVVNDKPLFVQVDLPMLELNHWNKKDVLSSLHPAIKLFVESSQPGGWNIFLGRPIERFPGEVSPETGVGKMTEHTLGTLFPPLQRYYFREKRAEARGTLSAYWLSELTGMKFRAVDVRRVLRGRLFEQRRLARLFKQRLRQEGVLPSGL